MQAQTEQGQGQSQGQGQRTVMGTVTAAAMAAVREANRSQLARDLQTNRSHISNVLAGRDVPSLCLAARIAKELGISLDQFHRYWVMERGRVQ